MKWLRIKIAAIVFAACISVVPPLHAQQHRDQALYDQVQRVETHLDNTDKDEKQNAHDILDLREQLEAYKDYALGFCGCFTVFMGFLKFIGRKGEQSA